LEGWTGGCWSFAKIEFGYGICLYEILDARPPLLSPAWIVAICLPAWIVAIYLPVWIVAVCLPVWIVAVCLPAWIVAICLPGRIVAIYLPVWIVAVYLPAWIVAVWGKGPKLNTCHEIMFDGRKAPKKIMFDRKKHKKNRV
jgi:hypothetical protein